MRAPSLLERLAPSIFLKEWQFLEKCPRCLGEGGMQESAHTLHYGIWRFTWTEYVPSQYRKCWICEGTGQVVSNQGA